MREEKNIEEEIIIPSENDNLFDLLFDGEKFPKKLNILIKPSANRKDIEYKKILFPTINNTKVEYNIDLIQESKTYIITLYADYSQKPISINVYFNNSNEEVLY